MSLWDYLDSPLVWEASRTVLDLSIGLYRKRFRLMRRWGLIGGSASFIDIGCGGGQYARVIDGEYLGIDLNDRYIRRARSKRRRPNVTFRTADANRLAAEGTRFDSVLMVDVVHHLSDDQAHHLLTTAAMIARRNIICFDPITEQTNALGHWVIRNDRGDHVRNESHLLALFSEAGVPPVRQRRLRLGPITTLALLAHPRSVGSFIAA
jgi:2-polyprenyl-3-methyl-5-hydroxy-6-metoxy-1,4-benzoquinol methylase